MGRMALERGARKLIIWDINAQNIEIVRSELAAKGVWVARISEALKTFTRGGLKSVLYSDEFSLRDRLFALAGVVGSFAVLGVAVITTLAEQGVLLSIALFSAYFLYVACIFLAFKTGKTNFFGSIVVIVVAFIAFPMGYFLGGGANSGTSTWFVVILLFIAAVFPNRLFWVYSIKRFKLLAEL